MKNYANILTPVATLCFVGSLAIHGAMVLVTLLTGSHIGGNLPMTYMESLNLPMMSILLPVVGMALFALLLPSIVKRHEVIEVSAIVGNVIESVTVKEEHHSNEHLKAA